VRTKSKYSKWSLEKKHLDKYKGASFIRGHNPLIVVSDPVSDSISDNYESSNKKPCIKSGGDGTYTEDIPTDIADSEPIDQCIYDFIKLFGDLYPTVIGLMGGTEEFPPESIMIECNDIPPNYDCLTSLPEYLWRFNDYSYCRYLEYTNSKQFSNAIASKINAKAKILQSI